MVNAMRDLSDKVAMICVYVWKGDSIRSIKWLRTFFQTKGSISTNA